MIYKFVELSGLATKLNTCPLKLMYVLFIYALKISYCKQQHATNKTKQKADSHILNS